MVLAGADHDEPLLFDMCLQMRQPAPSQNTQLISTSADGCERFGSQQPVIQAPD
jgi:hypothetical protein